MSVMSRHRLGLSALVSLVVVCAVALPAQVGAAMALPPLSKAVYSRYIIRTSDQAGMTFAFSTAVKGGGRMVHRYRSVYPGGAFDLTPAQVAALKKDKRIVSIEPDRLYRASVMPSIGSQVMPNVVKVETSAPWGLDRIDQKTLPTSGKYRYTTTGAGVTAYVIDTGIRPTHAEFGNRVRLGYDGVGDGRGGVDCNGHGTHVAGTIGGTTYGVAKKVSLVAVRVLNCDGGGRLSDVIAGVDWVVSDHESGPAVANMSLGGIASHSLDLAVKRAIADGVTMVVAAGNDGGDACLSSPAEVPAAITVGATQANDMRADFSNYGECLDLFAPGVDITSSWDTSDTSTKTISGTSMATPHVAGAAARYLESHAYASPATVRNALVRAATSGAIPNLGPHSPDRLLYIDPTN
jgi:aqualysin 1